MRILQVGKYYYPQRGGIETHLRQLSQGLSSSARVEVVVAGNPKSQPQLLDGIRIERLPAAIRFFGAPICPKLISRLRTSDADLVHVHLPNPWAVISYIASGCRLPLVVTYHSDIIRQSILEPAIRPIHMEFLSRASVIISTSANLIQNSKTLRRFQERCVVIPFGVDIDQIDKTDLSTVRQIRSAHKSPLVLAVGRLVSYKGFEYLIRAMSRIDASLVIVGKGPLKKSLLQLASELKIESKITIMDDIEDVTPYFQAADVFVLPSVSRNEAFGIVQIEAMAAGKPVINTQLASGVPNVSLHGITGITVPPADHIALGDAIIRLLSDQELCAEYGKAGRLRAISEFSLEAMLARTLDVYNSVTIQRREAVAAPLGRRAATAD